MYTGGTRNRNNNARAGAGRPDGVRAGGGEEAQRTLSEVLIGKIVRGDFL